MRESGERGGRTALSAGPRSHMTRRRGAQPAPAPAAMDTRDAIARKKENKDEMKELMRADHTCCFIGVLVGVALMSALIGVFMMKNTSADLTRLRQVHVVLSHGERTPTEAELNMLGAAPERNVTFAPYGPGALTNEGKQLTYEMGCLLKNRYSEFLGNIYYKGETILQTTSMDIAKMSALLVAAGLWPPEPAQSWTETLAWQPVPYHYPKPNKDFMLYAVNCPRYQQEKERILQNYIEEGLLQPYRDLFQKLSAWTARNLTKPAEALLLNNLIVIQEDIKVPNPKWAKHVKKKLLDVARMEYNMMFQTNLLKKLSGGALLHKIIRDSMRRMSDDLSSRPGTKMHLYSGGIDNVAALLAATDVVRPHQPEPGAAFVVELHQKLINGQYGFKIFYWDDDSAEPRLVEVPGCGTFCPYDTLVERTRDVVTADYEGDCRAI